MAIPFVFLDFDGTLVNSETLLRDVEMGIIRRYGVDLSEHDWHEKFQNLTVPEFALVLESLSGLTHDWGALLESEYEHAWSTRLTAHPGCVDIVNTLGNRRAIVTSSSRSQLERKLNWAELPREWADGAVTSDDVAHRKPDPEPYLLALDTAGISAHSAIAIEDSRTGVTAAVAAGIRVIGFPGGLDTAGQLADAGATVARDWFAIGRMIEAQQ